MSEAGQLSQPTPLSTVEELSRSLLINLYGHNKNECLPLLAPDILFVGSIQHMSAHGFAEAERLIDKRFKSFKPALVLSYETLSVEELAADTVCVVASTVISSPTYAGLARANERLATLIWSCNDDCPQLRHLHLSSPLPDYSGSDDVHLNRESYAYIGRIIEQQIVHRSISIRDVGGTMHYVLASEIRSIEACKQRTILHCLDRNIVVRRGFKDMVDEFGNELVLVHRSFAVNPLYVRTIHPDSVVLDDGSSVPVPQRRSAEVRRELSEAVQRIAGSFKIQDVVSPERFSSSSGGSSPSNRNKI